jgi:hypothetical protein
MPPSNEYENDPVDALLKGGKFDRDEQLRDIVLTQTTAVLRRRRHVRRAGVVAALAVCYLAGAATMRLWRPLASDDGGLIAREAQERPPEMAPEVDRVATKPTEEMPDRQRQPHKLRRAGFEDIRRVSDRYLHEKGDVALALRYYRRALDSASTEQRAISVEEDSWLLMALNTSQMEEKEDDNNG